MKKGCKLLGLTFRCEVINFAILHLMCILKTVSICTISHMKALNNFSYDQFLNNSEMNNFWTIMNNSHIFEQFLNNFSLINFWTISLWTISEQFLIWKLCAETCSWKACRVFFYYIPKCQLSVRLSVPSSLFSLNTFQAVRLYLRVFPHPCYSSLCSSFKFFL